MTVDDVRGWLTAAGYDTEVDRDDAGIVRAYRDGAPRIRMGMVVIRQDPRDGNLIVTYAELASRVFPFWRDSPYSGELARFRDWIRKNPNRTLTL